MSYIDNNLMSGEKVMYRTHLHWVVYLWPAVFLLAGISMFFAAETAPAGVLFVLLSMGLGLGNFIRVKTSEFGVTDKRVMIKVGWIRRTTIETLLAKIEALEVHQGIIGRILNYGTIVISGTGGTKSSYHKIRTPLDFRRHVHEQTSKGSS